MNFLLSYISIAARTVVPVDGILFIKQDRLGKVGKSFIVVQKAIPHQSTSIKSRSICLIELDHFIEISEGIWQSISTYFFSYCPQVMQSRNIIWLKLACFEIIFFCLIEFALLIETKCSIIVGFEMSSVKFDSLTVIFYCFFVLFNFSKGETSIMVKVCFIVLQFYSQCETIDSIVEFPHSIK